METLLEENKRLKEQINNIKRKLAEIYGPNIIDHAITDDYSFYHRLNGSFINIIELLSKINNDEYINETIIYDDVDTIVISQHCCHFRIQCNLMSYNYEYTVSKNSIIRFLKECQ